MNKPIINLLPFFFFYRDKNKTRYKMPKKQMNNHLLKMAIEKAMLNSAVAIDYDIPKFELIAATEEKDGLIRVAARHKLVNTFYNLSVFNVYIHIRTMEIHALWDGYAAIVDQCGRPIVFDSEVYYGDFTYGIAMEWIEKNVLPIWDKK